MGASPLQDSEPLKFTTSRQRLQGAFPCLHTGFWKKHQFLQKTLDKWKKIPYDNIRLAKAN
jgi:hypothetical protein